VVHPGDGANAPDLEKRPSEPASRRRDARPASQPARPNLTDYGNAQRFVAMHGHEVRYCPAWGAWLVWDGRRWRRDDHMEIERGAKATVMAMYAEVARLDDDQERRDLADWATKSESKKRIADMIALARSEPGVTASPGEFDEDRWLLNCRNGTIDLKTGNVRPHDPADLIRVQTVWLRAWHVHAASGS
jgi:putative DNA primase/helicase